MWAIIEICRENFAECSEQTEILAFKLRMRWIFRQKTYLTWKCYCLCIIASLQCVSLISWQILNYLIDILVFLIFFLRLINLKVTAYRITLYISFCVNFYQFFCLKDKQVTEKSAACWIYHCAQYWAWKNIGWCQCSGMSSRLHVC